MQLNAVLGVTRTSPVFLVLLSMSDLAHGYDHWHAEFTKMNGAPALSITINSDNGISTSWDGKSHSCASKHTELMALTKSLIQELPENLPQHFNVQTTDCEKEDHFLLNVRFNDFRTTVGWINVQCQRYPEQHPAVKRLVAHLIASAESISKCEAHGDT